MTQIERRHFAAGDYLTRFPEGHNYEIQIDAPFDKPGWKVRTFSPAGESIFPGSAIEFEGAYYELFFRNYSPGPPVTVSYHLKKWDDRFPIRVQFHYNEQECRNTALAYRNRLNKNRIGFFLTLFSPIAGMLPAEDQTRIANQHGMKATHMTFFSALLVLPLAGFLMLFSIIHIFGNTPLPGPGWMHWIYPTGFYFFAESLLRMMSASKLDEPVGSMILSVPVLLWRNGYTYFHPRARRKVHPARQLSKSTSESRRDQVNPLPDEDHVEIVSLLPKPHWNSRVGIGLNGTWYGVVETEKITRGDDIRYRFLLKKAPEGTWFASVIDYNSDEVENLYQNKRHLERKTWVDTFAFCWGFLSREDQIRMEELYDFDSLKFTKLSISVIAILSGANLVVSIMNLAYGLGQAVDVWLIFPAAFLLLETFSRWKDWKAGHPSGSVLGVLVRPFARKLLTRR